MATRESGDGGARKPRGAAPKPERKPVDRQRRQRILLATLQVIGEEGMPRLSHRRVAKVAGVPLSATSYYYGSLDDLVEAALSYAVERDVERFRAAVESHRLAEDPIRGIAELADEIGRDMESGVLALELCVAAIRSDRLRPLARRWDEAWLHLLEPHLGPRKAMVANTLIVGIVLRSAMSDDGVPVEEIAELLHEALDD